MKIGFVSLGCPKNLVDSEVMLGMAEKEGHEITPDASQADVLVVNTCAFIDRAKQESIDTILEMAELKKQAPGRKLIVTGCLAERYRDELKKEIPEIDAVLGTGEVDAFTSAVSGIRHSAPGTASPLTFYKAPPVFGVDLPTYIYDADTPRKRVTPGHYAYVKIAEGCDYKCAFCIIPKMRGHYRSRPIESIVQEAKQLASQGVKELLLISQDTTFYGIDRGERGALPVLLRALNDVDGIEWIRLLYLYPTTITSEVIDAIADLDKVVKYIDLPLQHASDAVLKRMKRPGTRQSYRRLLDNIRARIPNVALRTTFIVGFPGETAAAFDTLLDFIRETKFERLGIFAYSQEEGTIAGKMASQLTDKVKQRRREQAMAAQHEVARAVSENFVSRTLKVLIEGEASAKDLKAAKVASWEHGLIRGTDEDLAQLKGRYLIARGEADAPDIDGRVYVRGQLRVGNFAKVKIIGHTDYDLIAEPI